MLSHKQAAKATMLMRLSVAWWSCAAIAMLVHACHLCVPGLAEQGSMMFRPSDCDQPMHIESVYGLIADEGTCSSSIQA